AANRGDRFWNRAAEGCRPVPPGARRRTTESAGWTRTSTGFATERRLARTLRLRGKEAESPGPAGPVAPAAPGGGPLECRHGAPPPVQAATTQNRPGGWGRESDRSWLSSEFRVPALKRSCAHPGRTQNPELGTNRPGGLLGRLPAEFRRIPTASSAFSPLFAFPAACAYG